MRLTTVSYFVFAAITACSGDKGGPSGGQPGQPSPTPESQPGGEQTGSSDLASLTYTDVRGLHDKPIPANMFLSQLNETQLQPACGDGQVFEFDVCWDSIVIDADQKSIQFYSESGTASAKIEIGKSVPNEFKRAIFDYNDSEYKSFGHHHSSSLRAQYFSDNRVMIDPGSTLMQPYGFWSMGQSPWATSGGFLTTSTNKIDSIESESLASIAVKTTFTYGLLISPMTRIAHNWHYKGAIKFGGKTYNFPISLLDIEPDIHNFKSGVSGFHIENNDGTVQLLATGQSNMARKGNSNGALLLDYIVDEVILGMDVTEVEEQQRLREEEADRNTTTTAFRQKPRKNHGNTSTP